MEVVSFLSGFLVSCWSSVVIFIYFIIFNLMGILFVELYLNHRWEEERYTDGVKWKFLEHKGPVFAPPYDPLPSNVKFYYDGKITD